MIIVQGLCRDLKRIKNGKKNETGYSLQRKKRCFVLSVGNTNKDWKRWLASLKSLYKGVTTSRSLVRQTMIRCLWQGPETVLKVDPFAVTISGFSHKGKTAIVQSYSKNIYSSSMVKILDKYLWLSTFSVAYEGPLQHLKWNSLCH